MYPLYSPTRQCIIKRVIHCMEARAVRSFVVERDWRDLTGLIGAYTGPEDLQKLRPKPRDSDPTVPAVTCYEECPVTINHSPFPLLQCRRLNLGPGIGTGSCLPACLPACCLPACLPACPPACLPACLQSHHHLPQSTHDTYRLPHFAHLVSPSSDFTTIKKTPTGRAAPDSTFPPQTCQSNVQLLPRDWKGLCTA